MATVTAVRTLRHGSKSRLIVLDGEPWRSTSSAVIARHGLTAGDTVDPGALEAQLTELEPTLARERAILLLSYRDRSVSGLIARLMEDGYSHDLAQSVVGDLERLGFVDDQRYSAVYARSLTEFRGMGRSRALREMTHAGLPSELASAALDEVLDPEDERQAARRLAASAAGRTGATVDKVASRLIRRGYAPRLAFDAARSAFDAIAQDTGMDDPEGHDGFGD